MDGTATVSDVGHEVKERNLENGAAMRSDECQYALEGGKYLFVPTSAASYISD